MVLLDARANSDAQNGNGPTPLHLAAQRARAKAVVALLDAGANGSLRNESGQTPFEMVSDTSPLNGSDAYWQLNEARFR